MWKLKWKYKFFLCNVSFNFLSLLFFSQGLDEEAIVDHGKTSFATLSNYEKDDFESKFKTARPQVFFLQLLIFLVLYWVMEM